MRLFRRRGHGRRLFFTSTSFTRRTHNRLDKDGWIATAHRHRNNQAIKRVRRHRLRHRTSFRRFRNNLTKGLDLSRVKGMCSASRGDL